MRRSRSSFALLLALVLTLVAAAGGCGGGDEGADTSGDTGAQGEPQPGGTLRFSTPASATSAGRGSTGS